MQMNRWSSHFAYVIIGLTIVYVTYSWSFKNNVVSYVISRQRNNMTRIPQKACSEAIDEVLDKNLTDDLFASLVNICLQTKKQIVSLEKQHFSNIFVEQNFGHVKCTKRLIGPPRRPMPLVALASYPGSGNTWVRYLIEQISGIQTGSIYNGIVRGTFTGESVCPTADNVFTIKTHKYGDGADKVSSGKCRFTNGVSNISYSEAIYILRNPFNTLVADYNYWTAGKTAVAPRRKFLDNTDWRSNVHKKSARWFEHVDYWLANFDRPVHVIVYDNLQDNLLWEMYKLFRFLKFPITARSLYCLTLNKEGLYHRPRQDWMTHDALFSPSLSVVVTSIVDKIRPVLLTHGVEQEVVGSYYRYNELK